MKFIDAREHAAALFIVREKNGSFRQIASARFEALTGYKPLSAPAAPTGRRRSAMSRRLD